MEKTIAKLPSHNELLALWKKIDPELPEYNIRWSFQLKSSGANIDLAKRLIKLSARVYLQYGMEAIDKALRHEAAHAMAYFKHGKYAYQHNRHWFIYYLVVYRATRHSPTLTASMRAKRFKVVKRKRRIKFNSITKVFEME